MSKNSAEAGRALMKEVEGRLRGKGVNCSVGTCSLWDKYAIKVVLESPMGDVLMSLDFYSDAKADAVERVVMAAMAAIKEAA